MAGTFSVNDQPITLLFDSGASHTFISKECVLKLGLEMECLKSPYSIHSLGGQIITNQMTRQVPLQLQGKIYPTYFIILPTQKVDIILGMTGGGTRVVATGLTGWVNRSDRSCKYRAGENGCSCRFFFIRTPVPYIVKFCKLCNFV